MAMQRWDQERQEELWVASQSLPSGRGMCFMSVSTGCWLRLDSTGLWKTWSRSTTRRTGGRGLLRVFTFGCCLSDTSRALPLNVALRGVVRIVCRCSHSLGLDLTEKSPDHSSLTRLRDRYPVEVADEVFAFVLGMARERKLISGAQVGVDATLLEANAAMKSIVRRDTDEDWKQYLTRLMSEDGLIEDDDEPSDEDLRRFDRSRQEKKVSNKDWKSPVDDDARIVKLKDERTHLGYKAEHTVDLDSEFVLSATVQDGTEPDSQTLCDAVIDAQENLECAGSAAAITEVAADKGYHANAQLAGCDEPGLRTYIPEPSSPRQRKWADKCDEVVRAVANNRRRMKRPKGKQLQKLRSERVERSFAHVCETGGARRTWLRGLQKFNKRYRLTVAADNLGLLMRPLFGTGQSREFAASPATRFRNHDGPESAQGDIESPQGTTHPRRNTFPATTSPSLRCPVTPFRQRAASEFKQK